MLMDQNSRYASAVGRPSIGSKIGADELSNPATMRNTSRSLNSASINMFSRSSSSAEAKTMSAIASEEIIKPRGPRSMGSAAGFRGEKSAYLEINGGGYMGSSRRAYRKGRFNSVSMASFEAKDIKKAFRNRASGRLANNSMSKMKTLKSLSRLV